MTGTLAPTRGSATPLVLPMISTRRAFLTGLAAASGLFLPDPIKAALADGRNRAVDVSLRIGPVSVDVAPGHVIHTVGYNGCVPGPLIRMREGVPVLVEITNDTDRPEYVHWHGFPVSALIDGTQEENSLVVPPHGNLRYQMTPLEAGARWVHSHAMAMTDLSRGVYSGQFGFVYVEPKTDPGRYDQEVFLATHEWEPFFLEGDEMDAQDAQETFGETDWGPVQVEVGYGIRSINGRALGHGEPIRVREGERVLFHLLNASATENLQISLPEHEFLITALDGNPVPRPRRVRVVELGVAERVDAVVEMNKPGVWILGSTDDDVRGAGLGVLIEYAGRKGPATQAKPQASDWGYTMFGDDREASQAGERIPLVIERVPPGPDTQGLERWTINGKSFDSTAPPRKLHRGVRYRLVFDNRSADAHPLHLHRNTFELTAIYGKQTSGVRKDVVVVKAYQTVEVDFTPHQAGLVLFHCHQQMHMDSGFKTLFDVP